jgi:hypothetical protein
MIQNTSRLAFESIQDKLGSRQYQVYNALRMLREATNAMISQVLCIPINQITPRCLELRNMKLVGVSKEDKCRVTGRKAIYWKVVQ